MTKMNKELRLDMPYTNWLERYTKEELTDIAQLLGVGIPDPDGKKGRVVEEMDGHIRYNMDSIIDITSVVELEFLRKLLLPENRYGIVSPNIDAVLPLTRTGIIISSPQPLGPDFAIYMMLDEVKEWVRPYIELEWQNKKQHGYDRLERLAVGVLNLFGGMRAEDLFTYMREYIDARDRKQWGRFEDYLLNNTLLGARRIFHINPEGRTDCFLASPYIRDDDELHRMFNYAIWDHRTHHYVDFPKEMVLDYGRMPFPHITSPSMDVLRDIMLHKAEHIFTEEETERMLYKLWITHETHQTAANADIMMTLALKASPKEEEAQGTLTEALANNFRDLPEWNMDGKSTNDLVSGIERTTAKIEQRDSQPKGETNISAPIIPFMPPVHKVGRNDPCPCGSGKKFKHCHGK